MKLNGKAWMTLAIMILAVGIVISAMSWPFDAALFPMLIGIPLFFLSTLQFIILVIKKEPEQDDDSRLAELEHQVLENRRTLTIFLWIIGFFFMVLLIGFPIAVPLFVFCYMKLQGKEKWTSSIIFTLIAWGAFYGLFTKLCNIPFMEGWVQEALTAVGILPQ
jgi:hypothetical protein